MKVSTLSIISLSSLFSILPVQISTSCAWSYDDDEVTISPFNSEALDAADYYPFFFSYHYFNGGTTDYSVQSSMHENAYLIFDSKAANLTDWKTYFKNAIPETDLEAIIYETTADDYKLFDAYLNGKGNLPEQWSKNKLMQFWIQNKNHPSFQYLNFAKNVEPYVAEQDYWEPVQRDIQTLTTFKKDAMRKAEIITDPSIKLRYAFQAMRCAHYSKDYVNCIKIYDAVVDKIQTDSQIKYWCLSLKAGAYWRQNKFAEASYFNAIVFDKCPSRRLSAERDFWIDSEKTWQQCLSYCKNDHEKNILWFLTGINQHNSAIPALYEMLKLEPASKEVEVLLAREVEKIQRNTMPLRWATDFDNKEPSYYSETFPANDLNEIYIFITKGLATKKILSPAYWENAAAFIQYVNKEYQSCNKHADLAIKEAAGNNAMISQAKILKTLCEIDAPEKIDTQVEKNILTNLQWLYENGYSNKSKESNADYYNHSEGNPFKQDAYRIAMYRLMMYYLHAGKPVQAEMCKANAVEYYDIYERPEQLSVDELYHYFTNTSNSEFDKFLAKQYPYTADDMMEIKGTLLMQNYQWKDALAAFKKMHKPDENTFMKLPTDPFLIHINDCHDCDFMEHPDKYTKISLCEKMMQLENLMTSKDINKAQTAHQLANAYYNISYFGNSWMAIDYYRCHGCEDVDRINIDEASLWYYTDFFSMQKAMEYYTIAAEGTKDKEFAAKNYFMLAKCEQNNYYLSADYSYLNEENKKIAYRSNFKKLKAEYSNTSFYKEAINECKYFSYYVNLR